jgi:ascorbate PTS system EIIA or EIIAB component
MSVLLEAFASGSIQVGVTLPNREEAISLAGQLLVDSGRVQQGYIEEMLSAIEEYGPYIVIAPGIALAHGRPSETVLANGLSLVVLSEPIVFGSERNDPVSLVFGLAATGHEEHLEYMAALAEALSTDSFVNSLLNANDSEQIRSLLASPLGQ